MFCTIFIGSKILTAAVVRQWNKVVKKQSCQKSEIFLWNNMKTSFSRKNMLSKSIRRPSQRKWIKWKRTQSLWNRQKDLRDMKKQHGSRICFNKYFGSWVNVKEYVKMILIYYYDLWCLQRIICQAPSCTYKICCSFHVPYILCDLNQVIRNKSVYMFEMCLQTQNLF